MKIHCKITGLALTLEQCGNAEVLGFHPLLTLELPQLHTVCQQQELRGNDQKILLLAYLLKTNLVRVQGTVPIYSMPSEIPHRLLVPVMQICNFANSNPTELHKIPKFVLSADTLPAVYSWIQNTARTIENRDYITHRTGQNLERLDAFQKAKAIRKNQQRNRFEIIVTRALQDMMIYCESFNARSFEILSALLLEKENYPRPIIQEFKSKILDYLPEDTLDAKMRKDTVLEKLDLFLAEAAEMYEALGIMDAKETEAEMRSLAKTYTLETDSGEFLNSAAEPAIILSRYLEREEGGATPKPVKAPEVPTAQPKREDYPNALKFAVAAKLWEQQVTTAGK